MNKDIDEKIAEKVFKIYRQLRKRSEKKLSKFSLNIVQAHCLFFISEKKQINYKELSKKLDVSLATVSAIIERLIKNGYIKRINSKEDRRVFYLELTDKAKKTIEKIKKEGCFDFRNILRNLTLTEKRLLAKLTEKISSCLD